MRCKNLSEIVAVIKAAIDKEREESPESGCEFFFRGESKNFESDDDSVSLGTAFKSTLDRKGLVEYERDLYEDAMRLNVADFYEDRTMTERICRMQHYSLPTRFADICENALLSTHFACGAGDPYHDPNRDGYIRVIKVAMHKLKSFNSDIIIAISHLPLVKPDQIDLTSEDGVDYLRYEIMNDRPGFQIERAPNGMKQLLIEQLQQVWAFRPIINNRRVRAQSGLFLAFGCGQNKQSLQTTFAPEDYEDKNAPTYGIKQIDYVQIAAEAKNEIRDELRYYGMSGEVAYPELSDACKELDRKYQKLMEEN